MGTREFEEIYHRYKQMLFRIAYSYVKNTEDAEDLVQEAFVKRLYQAPDFLSEEHEKRWMIRIMVNLSKNFVQSFWYRKRTSVKEALGVEQADWQLGKWESDLLREVLELPDKCKAPIYLHYYEGYTCKEIAEILGCKESAVKMRLKKGRELLKMELLEGEVSHEIRGI